jgi:hypothetical protein
MADEKPAPASAAQPVAADKPPGAAPPAAPASAARGASSAGKGESPKLDGAGSTPAAPAAGDDKPAEKPEGEKKPSEFVQLAREQRELRKQRDAFVAEQKKTESERANERKELEDLRALRAALKSPNAMAVLRKEGLSYNDLVKQEMAILEQENSPEAKRIAALEEKLAAKEKAENDGQLRALTAQRETAKRGVIGEIATVLTADPEGKFEFAAAMDAKEHVFAEMERVFHETAQRDENGQIVSFKSLPPQEAAAAIERKFEEVVEKLLKTKKAQKMFAELTAKAAEEGKTSKEEPKPGAKPAAKEKTATKKFFEKPAAPEPKPATLDNSLTQGVPPEKPLSLAERRARAFQRFAGANAQG